MLQIPTPLQRSLLVTACEDGILSAQFVASGARPPTPTTMVPPLLREAQIQVRAYFARRLSRFDLPLALCGTALEVETWRLVASLAFGHIVSYAEVAGGIGRPAAHRGVAAALSKTEIALFVPAYRVVGSDRRIHGALPGSMRHRLLRFEGFTVRRSGLIAVTPRRKNHR